MKTPFSLTLACAFLTLGSLARAQVPTVNLVATDAAAAETWPGEAANTGGARFTRTGGTASPLTVAVRVRGLAVQGLDYRFGATIGSVVTFPAGSAQVNVTVTPIDDALLEGPEDVRIDLQDSATGVYLVGNDDRAVIDLADNEDPLLPPRPIVTVAALDGLATETVGGTDPAAFRITRTNNLNVALEVRYALGGTATMGADYTTPPATIAIPAGVASVDVVIAPIDDPLVESAESVTFTLLPHPNTAIPPPVEAYALGTPTTASVTIVSEDVPPPPSVAITSPVNGTNHTLPAATPISLAVNFTASDVNGYIASYKVYDGTRLVTNTTITYPSIPAAGTPYSGSVTIPNAYGGVHQLVVWVTDNSGVTSISAPVSVTVTYIYPIMAVAAADAEAAEVAAGGTQNPAVFAITVDTPMPIDQYVFYRLTSPGPGVDFILPNGYSLTNWPINIFTGPTDYGVAVFPAGATRVDIVVTPVDDLHLEGPETLTIALSYPFVIDERTFEGIVQFTEGGFHVDPNAIPVRNFQYDIGAVRTATATILDNDTVPAPFSIVTLATTDSDAQETAPSAPANPGAFTITRDGPTALPLTVNYAITAPPRPTVITARVAVAQNGVDFTTISGTATIPAGATSADIVIAPIYDLLSEPSELIQVSLLPPTIPLPDPASYMLGAGTVASLTIRDATLPEGTPIVRITATDSQAYESAAPSRTASFSVIRTGSLADAITVGYTISGSATNGLDYDTLPGSVTIPAGSASASILVNPIDDLVEETIESVALILQTPPLNVEPPAYALGASSTMQLSAGVSIRDTYTPPLNRFQRALRLRFPHRYAVVQRYVAPTVAEATPPPPALPVSWAVEASSDLANWEEIGTVDPTEATDEYVDVNAADYAVRFYRFRPIPPPTP